ncbi:MAG: four helix bundle protein [Anaerolineales bacterium]|nr:four helix bundle protein [Anaerolineales bacterium]
MYQRAEQIADRIWEMVIRWDLFAKDTVGKQLCRAADSIGANVAESAGRFSPGDVIRFLHYARGSLRETRFWLKRAKQRQLITSESFNQLMSELNTMGIEINSYIKFQRTRHIKEPDIEYEIQPTNQQTNQQTNQPIN